MDIVIGSTQSIGLNNIKGSDADTRNIEARVLNIRPARKKTDRPASGRPERRTSVRANNDPLGACVLTLLIPEGHKIPRDINAGKYRILLRFVPSGR